MKKIVFFLSCLFVCHFSVGARTYYLNAVVGNDAFSGAIGQPWKTLAKCKAAVVSGDSVVLFNGSYGAYIENMGSNSRSNWVWYIAASGQNAVTFDFIDVDGVEANAYLHFEGIDIMYPAQATCPPSGSAIDITSFTGVNFITLKKCKIHGVRTYDSGGGVYFNHLQNPTNAVHDLLVDQCEIYQSGTGIRFTGSKTTITNCEIHHIHGTMIGNLCGPMSATDLNSASHVLIENNHLHDMHFYTNEPCYNTPGWSTAHSSIIGIRGRDWIVRNNHIHDAWSPGIQLYNNDCGGKYDRADLIFENNIFYDNQGYQVFYNPGTSGGSYIGGKVIFRHNTIVSGRQDSLWTLNDNAVNRFKAGGQVQSIGLILSSPSVNPYDGTGTLFEDNIFIAETGIGNFNYQAFTDTAAKWVMKNNLIYTKLWNCGTLDPSNFIITSNIASSQVPKDFIDKELFVAAVYDKQHGMTHKVGGAFDLSPKAGSMICNMSTTGSYVGAIACGAPTRVKSEETYYSVLVYPNPVSERLTLVISNKNKATKNVSLVLMDMLGQTIHTRVLEGEEAIIDMQDFAKGVYFLKVTTDLGNIATQKIIRE
jgi:hypothetical protein